MHKLIQLLRLSYSLLVIAMEGIGLIMFDNYDIDGIALCSHDPRIDDNMSVAERLESTYNDM